MSEEEQKMIWTIGLNDHISGGLDNIASRAEALRKSLSGVFKGLTDPADVVDVALEMVGKRLQEIGKGEKEASSALNALQEGFDRFTEKSASAKDVLTEWGKAFRDANVTGKDFVQVMAPLAAALDKLYQPTDKAVEVMDELCKTLEEIGVPVGLYKDELEKLEKQIDSFVRSGEGANELLAESAQLFQQMGASGSELDSLSASIRNVTEAEKRQAEAAKAAADAAAAHRAAIEEAKRASNEEVRNNFLKLAKAHQETTISSRTLSNQFLHLLQRMGALPPGVARFVANLNALDYALSSVGRKSKAFSGLADMFTIRIGQYAPKSVNVFTYAIEKLGLAIKGLFTTIGGGVIAAALAAFVGAFVYFQKQLEKVRESIAKTWEDALRITERSTRALSERFKEEAQATDEAVKHIKAAAKAYEELARSKDAVAKARSAETLAGIESDRKTALRENGDANPEANAVINAASDYAVAQTKASDLEREQALERELERNADREREKVRARKERGLTGLDKRIADAEADRDAWKVRKPTEDDIGAGDEYKYKNRDEYEKALKEWRDQLKAKNANIKTYKEKRDELNYEIAGMYDEDKVVANNRQAAEINRQTAKKKSDEELAARGDAYNRALYAYETNEQRKADAQTLKMDKLSRASASATKVRKEAEQKLAGSTDETEQVALQYAVKEKKIEEELAQTREKLERERYQLAAQTNDRLEQDRINSEYEYKNRWAELLAEREREELASAQNVHAQRVADAQKEYNERMAQLREEQSAARSRVQAAQSQVAKAWGWYRDKDSMAAYRDEQDADLAAQEQYKKDYYSLTHGRRAGQYAEAKELQRLGHTDKLEERMGEWRKKKMLSVDEEATMRVALAKDEEKNAIEYARQTSEDMKRAADSLEAIKATFEEGGE